MTISEEYSYLGRVSSVFVDEEVREIKVSVSIGPFKEEREIPFQTPVKGMWTVPEEGDIVEVYRVEREPYARYPHTSPEFTIPADLGEGDFCFKLNEATELRFSHQDDGTVNVDVTVDGDLTVSTVDGDVNVDSVKGNVFINGIDFDEHVHDYDDKTISDTEDGSGTSSDTTRTTTGPRNE